MSSRLWLLAVVAASLVGTMGTGNKAQAAFITGSVGFDFVNPTPAPDPNDLSTSSSINFPDSPSFTVATDHTGSFSGLTTGQGGFVVPPALNFSGSAVGSVLVNQVVFQIPGGFTFSTSSGFIGARGVLNPTTSTEGVFLLGTITSTDPGLDPTPGIASLSFSQSGTAITGSGTLTAQGGNIVTTPVPATALAAGLGGILFAGVRRLRRVVA